MTIVPSIRDLSSGSPTCGLTIPGGDVFCWGKASLDQFEFGPAPSLPAGIGRVETGTDGLNGYGCAIRDADGQLLCWGNNAGGQLGDGTTVGRADLVAVPDLPAGRVIDFDLTTRACAVVDEDGSGSGSVWCWGDGSMGSVVPGLDDSAILSPVEIIASGATKVGTGARFTCALVNGGVRCWGRNDSGQLGHGIAGETTAIVTVASP